MRFDVKGRNEEKILKMCSGITHCASFYKESQFNWPNTQAPLIYPPIINYLKKYSIQCIGWFVWMSKIKTETVMAHNF
jgi:hypothetical protein